MSERVAYGIFDSPESISDLTYINHPRVYRLKTLPVEIVLGNKSYIANASVDGVGSIVIKNFSAIAWKTTFNIGLNADHDYHKVNSYGLTHLDWIAPPEFSKAKGFCKIEIGSDVWIGRGSILKATNPEKPLVIGDGAVIASDSVVVKSVPPYAIVGGNPAQIIKYRFDEKIIEALLRIKWWDWTIDKIHDNFKYFNRVEEFVEIHDVNE